MVNGFPYTMRLTYGMFSFQQVFVPNLSVMGVSFRAQITPVEAKMN